MGIHCVMGSLRAEKDWRNSNVADLQNNYSNAKTVTTPLSHNAIFNYNLRLIRNVIDIPIAVFC